MSHEQINTERWQPIMGFQGIYEVSDAGRVRSLSRQVRSGRTGMRVIRARILRQWQDRGGYMLAPLWKGDSRQHNKRVHQAVLESFVGPSPEGLECCHNDGDPTNNKLSNLRWDTPSSNAFDRVRHGTCNTGRTTTRCGNGHDLTVDTNRLRRSDKPHLIRCGQCERDRNQARRTARKRASAIWTAADAAETLEACREHVAEVGAMAVVR